MEKVETSFFKLLRAALTPSQQPVEVSLSADEWRQLFVLVRQQSLTGLVYTVVNTLPSVSRPPMDVAMQWAGEAETIRGLNRLLVKEAARLTRFFEGEGRRTAILKGQANARLYPDRLSRQPGDIDIWVEGGRTGVVSLLEKNHMMPVELKKAYHHIHLPANADGVVVEVHFRPSSGNFNPFTNRRLQRFLSEEVLSATECEEGYKVPSMRFALVMQLAHIQRHFVSGGIGLRQLCDYFFLLRASSADDRREVSRMLGGMGLKHIGQALMWLLGEKLGLEERLMVCAPDAKRGERLLAAVLEDGNFGNYAERRRQKTLTRVWMTKRRQLSLMSFDFAEMFWVEAKYWYLIVKTLPLRIKYRKVSLFGME